MPAPKPDTSPKAVARVLREVLDELDQYEEGTAVQDAARALADALDQPAASPLPVPDLVRELQEARRYGASADAVIRDLRAQLATLGYQSLGTQAAAPTWEERIERALSTTNISGDISGYDGTDAALRAAFPELAPND